MLLLVYYSQLIYYSYCNPTGWMDEITLYIITNAHSHPTIRWGRVHHPLWWCMPSPHQSLHQCCMVAAPSRCTLLLCCSWTRSHTDTFLKFTVSQVLKQQTQAFSVILCILWHAMCQPTNVLNTTQFDMIYLLTAIGLSPGGSTHLHTNNT